MSQALRIPGHGGLNLATIYHEPATAAPHPVVILLHGFTGWKEEEHIASLAAGLAESGIAALRFDAPGSGESDGTWAENYRVSNYVEAVGDIYGYAVEHLGADPARTGIWGHSMGGMTAILAAARTPGRYAAVCGSQPSPGQTSLALSHEAQEWKEKGWRTLHNSHFPEIRLPYAFYEDRIGLSTATEAKSLDVPLLLIAGTHDKLVSATSVHGVYLAASEPKQYLELPATHGYKNDPEMLATINDATVSFFRKHLLS